MKHSPSAGNAQLLGVGVILLLLVGAAVWLFTGSTDVDPNGGEVPKVEGDGGQEPEAGTFEQGAEPVAGTGDGGAERVEVDNVSRAAEGGQAGSVQGTVQDSAGRPIAGAAVFLRAQPEATLFANPGPIEVTPEETARLRTTTGADGRYRFPELYQEERLSMWVSHPDYGPEMGPTLVILPGEVQEMPTIVLRDGYSVAGQVTDTAGNPLEAEIELRMQDAMFIRPGSAEQIRTEDTEHRRLVVLQSDGDGNFRADHLGEGIWTLNANADGFAANVMRGVVLANDQNKTDLVIELDTEHTLTGMVLDQNRNPIAGAKVTVGQTTAPRLTGSGVTGEDGSFTVGSLLDGSYSIYVTAEGFSDQRMGRASVDSPPVTIIMMAKAEITGRVSDPNGNPVPAFSLELMTTTRAASQYRKLGRTWEFENPNGDFTINELDPGTYVLLVRAQGFAPTYSPAFQTQREEVQGIDIVVEPGGLITGQAIDVVTGKPLAGATVSLHQSGYRPDEGDSIFGAVLQDLGNIPTTKTTTAADGTFRVEDAYVDRMALMVQKDGYRPTVVEVTTSVGIEVAIGRVEMRPGATISGVVSSPEGNPVAGSSVTLTRPNEAFQKTTTTDSRGRFSFDSLAEGSYELVAFPPADPNTFLFPTGSQTETIYVREGAKQEVQLTCTLDG